MEIAGGVDLRPEVARQATIDLGLGDIYTGPNLEQAIARTRPDFVVDVSVPQAHHDVTVTARAAGVPVLGEKPMADSMARAREMVIASERAGQLYMVSQSRRYNAGLAALRQLITAETGPPGILNSDFYIGAHFGGFRDAMAGPLLLDMAIHTFDAARYLTDTAPVAVYCAEFNPPWSWYAGNACVTALFEMSGGLRYTYRGSWCSEGHPTSWEGAWRAVGPRGSATWDGETAPVAELATAQTEFQAETETRTVEVAADVPAGIAGSLQDFLHALDTGAAPMGGCHDNIKSLAMVFGAIESAAMGRRVSLASHI